MAPGDLAAMVELHRRADAHDGIERVLEVDELAADLDDEHVVRATDVRVAEIGGRLAGYAYTYHLPSEIREERCYIFGAVDPELRGRGAGTALMRWGIDRATEQLWSSGRDLPRYVRADADARVVSAHHLFARMGMREVRYTDNLRRPLTDLPPAPALPGVRIVPWPVERSEEIRAAKNEAFADHWGSTPTSPHHWAQMTIGFGARLDLSFVALDDDDRVVAHCLNSRFEADDEVTGRREAWIDNLGTLREWRGRGIASALIAHSLHAFARDGLTDASISVDSENPTGAARLYRSLGFEPSARSITHEIELPPR